MGSFVAAGLSQADSRRGAGRYLTYNRDAHPPGTARESPALHKMANPI